MQFVLESPAVVNFSDGIMERDARLLVAGHYPGKNLVVTEADIDALVLNFSGPVPVKVEHIDSPLDPLGLVERVWRSGNGQSAELLGRIRFPAEMAAFLSKRDAHKLSVGLLKAPAWKLLEASLTLTPHVPTATLLSDGERVELATLRSQVRRQTVDAQIAELKASGRVLPATEALARILLSADVSALVTLSDGTPQSVSDAFYQFLKAQPPAVRFGETAPAGVQLNNMHPGAGAAAFSEEDHEIMKRLGVRPEDVAETMAKDKKDADDQKTKGRI